MIGEHSILELLLQASFVVQLVMLLLIGASVASWAIIFSKRKLLNDARQAADRPISSSPASASFHGCEHSSASQGRSCSMRAGAR